MIAEPPLLEGSSHERLILVVLTAVAVSSLGALGTEDADWVVALSEFDAGPVPMLLIAETR